MSNDRLWASRLLVVCPLGLLMLCGPVLSGQGLSIRRVFSPYDASEALRSSEAQSLGESFTPAPRLKGPAAVSADFLRHPLPEKLARGLVKIQQLGELGKHAAAIAQLQAALTRHPKALPYIDNLLGIEFVAVEDYPAARKAFEEVLSQMPHVSANYSNLAFALAALGEREGAEQALHTALALDHDNQKARSLLDALRELPESNQVKTN